MDYSIDRSYRIRYLLDAYSTSMNGGIQAIAQGNAYSFSTKEQAEQLLGIARNIEFATAKIVENSKQITGGVIYNYRDDSDPTNIYAYALIVDAKGPDGKPLHIEQFCGDLIAARLRENRQSAELYINAVGQLAWK